MDNKMSEVAKLLGVELEEEFEIVEIKNYIYKLTLDGLYFIEKRHRINNKEWVLAGSCLSNLFSGKYKINKKWKPKYGEYYFLSDSTMNDKFNTKTWDDGIYDNLMRNSGLIFKTQEEAIAMTNKILEFVKGGCK